MDYLVPILAVATMLLAVGAALWSKKRTEAKIEKPHDQKSSLAKDGPGPQPFR